MATENRNEENIEATKSNDAVDPFDKHLDIAIEAQDGKTDTNTETTDTGNKEPVNKEQQPDTSKGATSDGTAQPKPVKEGKEEGKPSHSPKDLTLGDGTVVRGGAERRFYEQREVARQQARDLTDRLNTRDSEYKQLQDKFTQLETTVQSLHGSDPKEISIGLNIVRDLQRDPQGTMKKLLAEVIAQGYTVEGIQSGLDAEVLNRIKGLAAPANTNTEQDDIKRIEADAHQEATLFFSRHPDAKPHDALIASVLRDHPELDLNSAYYQIKDGFAEKGFDWSLTLEENLKQSGLVNTEQTNANANSQPKPNTAPLPNGGNGAGGDVVVNTGNLSSATEDTGDIVREAMREAGMNI